MKSISELKSEALLSLNDKWGISVGCTLIFFIIGIALGLIPYIGNIASILVSGALSVGLCNFFLLVSKSEINPNIGAWLPNFLFLFVTLYIIKVVRK